MEQTNKMKCYRGSDGSLRVRNLSAYWLPELALKRKIGGTFYTVKITAFPILSFLWMTVTPTSIMTVPASKPCLLKWRLGEWACALRKISAALDATHP